MFFQDSMCNEEKNDFINEIIPDNMPMKQFFQKKSILLTGGTGFLGQLFVEKLLRTGVKEIYVLARPKKGKSSKERLSSIYSGPIYEKLAAIDPYYMKRIKIIEGDMLTLGVVLSENDRNEIIQNVQIVIHAAADVRFDETLHHLLLVNLRGTREILKLVEHIKKLEVCLYISTAYAHCPRKHIQEQFYDAPMDPEYMIQLAERKSDLAKTQLEILTERIIKPWPNTYTYSKALSEELVRRFGAKIPIAIIRPSIVIATHEDPIPGWINNIYGLTGVLVSTGLGLQRILPFKKHLIGDIVCADFVINSTLAVAWHTHKEKNNEINESKPNQTLPEIKIYHITSFRDRPVTYGEISARTQEVFYKDPSTKFLWIPKVNVTDYSIMEFVYTVMYHILPALIFDVYFKIVGAKVKLMPIYRKVHIFMAASTYFMTREWIFDNDVMKAVYDKMTPADKKFFPSDLRKYNYKDYCSVYYQGMRKYIVKDDSSNAKNARRKVNMFLVAHFAVLIFYYSAIVYLYYMLFKYLGIVDYIKEVRETFNI